MSVPIKRLIVSADDFGMSAGVNAGIIRAHREGIVTAVSLMVNELACARAVELARETRRLGVGLHLTLACGHSALPPARIPDLVNNRAEFSANPAGAGFRYFFLRSLREQLQAEIHAQFEKFRSTGLKLDHVNGHLHFHLHPTVFHMLIRDARKLGVTRIRMTFDSLVAEPAAVRPVALPPCARRDRLLCRDLAEVVGVVAVVR